MRDILFTPAAFDQYNEWQKSNKTIYERLNKIIRESARTPFEGTGKPEALKHDMKGYWSCLITDEHRLVYTVENDYIKLLRACCIIEIV